MVFTAPTNFALFKQRRQRFVQTIKKTHAASNGVVIVGAGFEQDRYAFRQESSFYYLTGISEPAALLFLYLDGRDVLYIPRFGTAREQWLNVKIAGQQDAARYALDQVCLLGAACRGYSFKLPFTQDLYADCVKDISALVAGGGKVFGLMDSNNEGYHMMLDLWNHLQGWVPGLQGKVVDVSPTIDAMRRSKDEYEVDLLHKAVQITAMAHQTAATVIKPERYEYEIQASIEYVFTHMAGCQPSFPSIVATGKNTTVLHYTDRNNQLQSGDLLVVDIGAEYGMYAADITRTYPVNGTFTPRQREVYEMVLATQAHIENIAVPGMYLKNPKYPEQSLHHRAVAFLEQQGYAKYFCHGIGHYLGLDVHDVGDYETPLEPGDVFTIEPGIYIAQENLGVRIEDDYVMADDGAVCLSYQLPKGADEIEHLMRGA